MFVQPMPRHAPIPKDLRRQGSADPAEPLPRKRPSPQQAAEPTRVRVDRRGSWLLRAFAGSFARLNDS